mmetsp:Transcript_86199/g.206529  ORF Transcript_86199/g.206529 Transcript_86199/m.206529 type:complete len:201 (+) Transcript_86199:567-1169(+)
MERQRPGVRPPGRHWHGHFGAGARGASRTRGGAGDASVRILGESSLFGLRSASGAKAGRQQRGLPAERDPRSSGRGPGGPGFGLPRPRLAVRQHRAPAGEGELLGLLLLYAARPVPGAGRRGALRMAGGGCEAAGDPSSRRGQSVGRVPMRRVPGAGQRAGPHCVSAGGAGRGGRGEPQGHFEHCFARLLRQPHAGSWNH